MYAVSPGTKSRLSRREGPWVYTGTTMADERKLRLEALAAVEKGNWKKAHECYADLEKVEAGDGLWPQKVGEACKKLGRPGEAVAAFGRAVDRYAEKGALLKAIAVCQLILQLDPKHSQTLEKLSQMHGSKEDLPAVTPIVVQAPRPAKSGAPAAAASSLGEMVAQAAAQTAKPGTPRPASFEVPFTLDEAPAANDEKDLARAAFPKTPLFSSLTEPLLRTMIERVRLRSLEPDEAIFYQGGPGDALYVIASGEMSVRTPREVARLGEGAFFGEIALLVDQPRAATMVATQPTQLLEIDRATVNDLIAESPAMLKIFLRFLRDRLTASVLETSPLFAMLTAEQRRKVTTWFQFGSAGQGTRLVEQKQTSPGLFVLLAGAAKVSRDGHHIADLGPGEAFGEISLLSGAAATATVEISTHSFLLMLPREGFNAVTEAHPAIQQYLGSLADDRLRVLRLLMI